MTSNEQPESKSPPVWIVRTGRHGERDEWALDSGFTGGGWNEVPDLSSIGTRDAMETLARELYGTENTSRLAVYTGQLWALRGRIEPGDTIALPLKTTSQIAVGTCTSGYSYDPAADVDKRHRIGVDWKRVDIPRSAIKQDLLYTLGSALTVFQAVKNDAQERMLTLLETGSDPGRSILTTEIPSNATTSTDATDNPELSADIGQVARDQITAYIEQEFAGHELPRLIAAILTAEGFQCDVSPPGKDDGIDIACGQGPLGLNSPRLVVQVKATGGTSGSPVVNQLQGTAKRHDADQALLVSWSGLTADAQRHVKDQRFNVRVWDSDDVLDAIIRVYPRLSDDIRAQIPLTAVWTLNKPDSSG